VGSAEEQLDGFLGKYSHEVEALARGGLAGRRGRIPGAALLVYDNYNALALAFAPTEKGSNPVLSIALYPRWVSLFVGAALPDPHGLLAGSGSRVRHVRLSSAAMIDDPRVAAFIAESVARSKPPFDPNEPQRLIIKSVSAKQRPRRP